MFTGIAEWVCEVCHNLMEATKVGKNKWKITCPKCGNTYYVDDDGDYIGE